MLTITLIFVVIIFKFYTLHPSVIIQFIDICFLVYA